MALENIKDAIKNTIGAGTIALATATAATAGDVEAVLADGRKVIVREWCDTTGFPNQDGSFDSNHETRGAMFSEGLRVVSGVNANRTAGRACSVPMDVYLQQQKEWDDDNGNDVPTPTPDPVDSGDGEWDSEDA